MKLVGLMPCRNEAWILGLTARAALMWCDALVVLDHASTDTTRWIIDDIASEDRSRDRIARVTVTSPVWDEMNHRQMMLLAARGIGATHVAIVDADEIWVLPRWYSIQSCDMPAGFIMELPGYNLRGGVHQYHSNGLWGNRWFSTAFRDDPALSWCGDRFHHREPSGKSLQPYRPIAQGKGGVMHLWGASERRLRAKHALYKITERLRWPDKPVVDIDRMYSWWRSACDVGPREPAWTYQRVPDAWWAPYAHLMQYLDVDAEPWQEAECRRLVDLHGAERFAGLDLFGVA